MSTLIDIRDVPEHFVLHGVSWSYYEHTLEEIGNRSIRVAFLDGVMELMSPLPEHEGPKKAIATLILELAVERDINIKSLGSTTFRREEKGAGSEPDECFYFNETDSVRGMKRFDPLLHRPPDLWVEVDIFGASVPREPICARLGVPEIWRYDGKTLTVRVLVPGGRYTDSKTSLAFPFLPMSEFAAFIPKLVEGNENRVVREFRGWVGKLPR